MKNNITTSEHLVSVKVIELVSFLTNGIAKKNTSFGSRSKFMGDVHISSIGQTPKNSDMRIRRKLPIKSFKRSLARKERCGQTINYMNSSRNTFCPKR